LRDRWFVAALALASTVGQQVHTPSFPNAANKGAYHRNFNVWMAASLKDAWYLEAGPDHQPDGTLSSAAARRFIKILKAVYCGLYSIWLTAH
jgi:hypothetical protein